jgi:hypothetical protein
MLLGLIYIGITLEKKEREREKVKKREERR